MLSRYLAIAGFGLVGIFARYGVDLFFRRWVTALPAGTFSINVLGSFVAGIVFVAGTERSLLSNDLRQGLMVGLLGGFTTFSTYSLQAAKMLLDGPQGLGALYFFLSPACALSAAVLGIWLGRAALT